MIVKIAYPVLHTVCGGVMFYYLKRPETGMFADAQEAVLLDGSTPKMGVFSCPNCKQLTVEGPEVDYISKRGD